MHAQRGTTSVCFTCFKASRALRTMPRATAWPTRRRSANPPTAAAPPTAPRPPARRCWTASPTTWTVRITVDHALSLADASCCRRSRFTPLPRQTRTTRACACSRRSKCWRVRYGLLARAFLSADLAVGSQAIREAIRVYRPSVRLLCDPGCVAAAPDALSAASAVRQPLALPLHAAAHAPRHGGRALRRAARAAGGAVLLTRPHASDPTPFRIG